MFWIEMLGQIPSMLFSVVTYVLLAIGLYTIAKRRCINHPWLAWVPVANHWILGCISDQYRYVALGQVKNKRKVLLALAIVVEAAAIVLLLMLGGMVFDLVELAMVYGENLPDSVVLDALVGPLMGILGVASAMAVVSIVHAVFRYMALHDLYASCDPKNKTIYLLLSIFISVSLPFFVFFSRKKDLGMPPRKDAQPVQHPETTHEPAQSEPLPESTEPWDRPEKEVEPWDTTEE
jgi:hypothetical protein